MLSPLSIKFYDSLESHWIVKLQRKVGKLSEMSKLQNDFCHIIWRFVSCAFSRFKLLLSSQSICSSHTTESCHLSCKVIYTWQNKNTYIFLKQSISGLLLKDSIRCDQINQLQLLQIFHMKQTRKVQISVVALFIGLSVPCHKSSN